MALALPRGKHREAENLKAFMSVFVNIDLRQYRRAHRPSRGVRVSSRSWLAHYRRKCEKPCISVAFYVY